MDFLFKKVSSVLSFCLFLLFLFLTINNFLRTSYLDSKANESGELVRYRWDNLPLHIIIITLLIAFFFFLMKRSDLLSISKIQIIWNVYFVVCGLLWITSSRSFPVYDQISVIECADQFFHGVYDSLLNGRYLDRYTHQLGLCFVWQFLFYLTGPGNYWGLMVINVFSMAITVNLLFKILTHFTSDKETHIIFFILMFGAVQAIFYSSFVYGTIIGLMFSVLSIYLTLTFWNSNKWRYLILSFISISLAVLIKSNFMIFLIGIILVFTGNILQTRKWRYSIGILLLCVAFLSPSLIKFYYQSKSGYEISEGMPSFLYVAMGLQEGPCASGWYNMYNDNTFVTYFPDREQMKEAAKEEIENSISFFLSNPREGISFFYRKISSQWNEPFFQSLWVNHSDNQHNGEISSFINSIYERRLHRYIGLFLNTFVMFLWLCNAYYYYKKRKNIPIFNLTLGIIFLGGFLFHLVWEAKALYIFPYYIISFPNAAMGMHELLKDCTKITIFKRS